MTDISDPIISTDESHHRDVRGGSARAAMFGLSDGLVSNISLILGIAGAQPEGGFVRLAGLAGLVAGAVSMAAGEYVSMKAQTELLEFELDKERIEILHRPENERRELAGIYMSRGVDSKTAYDLATAMMRNTELALETHAREELGIDPSSLGSPVSSAIASFFSFALGALIPLLPWFFASGEAAVLASILLGITASLAVGSSLARFTGKSVVQSAFRQLLIASGAAGVTYLVGSLAGAGGLT